MINQLKAQGVQHISQLLPVSKGDMLLRSVRAPPQVHPTPYLGLYPGRYLSLSSPYLCPCLCPPAGSSDAYVIQRFIALRLSTTADVQRLIVFATSPPLTIFSC